MLSISPANWGSAPLVVWRASETSARFHLLITTTGHRTDPSIDLDTHPVRRAIRDRLELQLVLRAIQIGLLPFDLALFEIGVAALLGADELTAHRDGVPLADLSTTATRHQFVHGFRTPDPA